MYVGNIIEDDNYLFYLIVFILMRNKKLVQKPAKVCVLFKIFCLLVPVVNIFSILVPVLNCILFMLGF